MDLIIGLVMIYVWVHSVVIVARNNTKVKRTGYENAVLIAGLVTIVLYVMGTV